MRDASVGGLVVAACCGIFAAAGAADAQPLTPDETGKLARFERESGLAGMPREFRAQEAARVAPAYAAARAEFGGQGSRLAGHYLRHTGRPAAQAYFFVLEAVGDAETARVLVRGLVDPPEPESGPEFESGGKRQRLPRSEGEIEVALEAVLVGEAAARDPGVGRALADAVAALRAKPYGVGVGTATRVVTLLGHCDSDAARDALRGLATDPDPDVRAAAVSALGSTGQGGDAGLFAHTLVADDAPRARVEAARALGALGTPDAHSALAPALRSERHPEVVDAIVQALATLDGLPDDPRECLNAAARAWDLQPASVVFACWRARADRAALVRTASEGPPMLRALAMLALFERPRGETMLMRSPRVRVPPPLGPQGNTSVPLVPLAASRRPPAPPPAFDSRTRTRLLASAVEVLSRPTAAFAGATGTLSQSVAYPMNAALFDIAGGDMDLALRYADRIVTAGARSSNDGRLAASHALWTRDASAYEAARRRPQALLAGALALSILILGFLPLARAAAIAAALPVGVWAVASCYVGGVRELPPLALAPWTILGSASLASGAIAATAALWADSRRARSAVGVVFSNLAAFCLGPVLALFACGAARWFGVFPVWSEGWELIFDPIGAALVAAPLTALGLGAAAGARALATRIGATPRTG